MADLLPENDKLNNKENVLKRYACKHTGCAYYDLPTWYPAFPSEIPTCDKCGLSCSAIYY